VTSRRKPRSPAPPEHPAPPADHEPPEQGTQTAGSGSGAANSGTGNGPVIMLSYAYAGADRVQDALAIGSRLACTSGTGIIPLCATTADTWRRIEDRPGTALSPLAAAAIRRLVTAQMAVILADSGQTRWCELAAFPDAAETFLQLFPQARFVCVHRRCLAVIQAAVQASPWGLRGQGLAPYLLTYPGNSVAAMAAYWVNSAEQLIAFEHVHQHAAHRLRYEDVAAQPDQALAAVRVSLGLTGIAHDRTHPAPPVWPAEPATPPTQSQTEVPTEMIPEPLLQRISRLHAELGYPPAPM
jgi:sulfotransferase family protein